MKKNILLVLLIVMVVAVTGILVSCDDKEKPQPTQPGSKELQDIDFFAAANNATNNDVTISVMYGDEEVYSYKNGREFVISDEIDVSKGTFAGEATQGRQYSAADFKDFEITKNEDVKTATFTAKIVSPSDFLGINSTVSDANIAIEIGQTSKAMQNITITYKLTSRGYVFDVTITINPKL